ncbi:MAG: DUF4012 domain-containing protein [Candidatus Magasanikbacteria bacterium]
MKILKIILIVILLLIIGVAGFGYWSIRSGNLQKAVVNKVATQLAQNPAEQNFLQTVMGFGKPRTYLILFLNNTELRPGGGFIGAYGLLRMDKGTPSLLKVEGTEILDNTGKKDFESVAPAPITKYLKVSRWYFRDSNWSPDFANSSQKSAELFLKQGGLGEVENIDAVIGFTPSVIEEILKIHGPIKINGEEFNATNFTEKLEYEVEYGYKAKGIEFDQRKNMLRDLAYAMLDNLRFDVFKNWQKYYDLTQRLLKEKQVVFYAQNNDEQNILASKDWAGKMKTSSGDYLLWADANLGSLKTDAAITRELSYVIAPTGTDKFVATAKMKFIHKGKFDWRTSRYRDYARVFVPVGSKLIKAVGTMESEKSTKPGVVDQGIENGRQWFGGFIAVEPGHTSELSFQYYLPENIVSAIKNGQYNLLTQKQIGTNNIKLTLDLNFGKNHYNQLTNLQEDREFKVIMAK